MKRLVLIIVSIFVAINLNAGEIAYGEINNISSYNLQPIFTKIHTYLINRRQPCDRFGYIVFPKSDSIIFWGERNILVSIDLVINA